MNRHYKTLELDKILERLAGMTSIEDAREMALNTLVANVIKNASRGKEYLPRTPVIHKNTSAVSVSRMPFIIL